MNPAPFIIAAYAVTLIGTAALVFLSYWEMRQAERDADELRREQ